MIQADQPRRAAQHGFATDAAALRSAARLKPTVSPLFQAKVAIHGGILLDSLEFFPRVMLYFR